MPKAAETGIVCGEGKVVSVDPTNARDIGLIRQAVLRGWLKSIPDLEAVATEMQAIAKSTDDERIVVAAGSVRVAVVDALRKAFSALLKESQGPREGDKHLHIHGGVANMNADELRNYIAARLGSSPDAAERD